MKRGFVDTNVLVYARDRRSPFKQKKALDWLTALTNAKAMVISAQSLREYYNAASRALGSYVPIPLIRKDVVDLRVWLTPETEHDHIEDAWALQDRFRVSFWDALIVASALRARCNFLLSEDLQADQDFAGLRVVNPFALGPEDVRAP